MSRADAAIVIVGDANVDLLVRLMPREQVRQPPVPEPAQGGTGANTAVAVSRLGRPVQLVGAIGDDGYGRFVRRQLSAQGVETSGLVADPEAPTMLVLAIIDLQGERTLVGWPRRGAAQAWLRPEQIDPTLIQRAAWLHTTGICLVEPPGSAAVLHALTLARAAGVPTSLDLNLRLGLENDQLPETFRAILWQAIEQSTVVFGSASDEIGLLAGHDDERAAARRLVAPGRTVIARRGAGGVLAVTETSELAVPAFDVPVVSTVGAGDAFNAGYITAAVEGQPLAEALRWGNAVAALTISGTGRDHLQRAAVAALLGEH